MDLVIMALKISKRKQWDAEDRQPHELLCASLERERLEVGLSLRQRRRDLKITQKDAAEALQITVSRLQDLERGRRVKEFRLLRQAYDYYLSYAEQNLRYQRLMAENLRMSRAQNIVDIRINGVQHLIPVVPRQKRPI